MPRVVTTRARPVTNRLRTAGPAPCTSVQPDDNPLMSEMRMPLCLLAAAVLLGGASCGDRHREQPVTRTTAVSDGAVGTRQRPQAPSPLSPEEKQRLRDIAKSSWAYLDANYQQATGLVNATPDWANTTLWDVGGQIIAYVAAKDLRLIPAA